MRRAVRLLLAALCCTLFLLFTVATAFAEHDGKAVAMNARAPHASVGATVWQFGPYLIEPCTAELICNNVILTSVHCLNFNYTGDMYFTLSEDVNALAGANRYVKVATEYKKVGQKRTRKILKDSISYGPFFHSPRGVVGTALAKFVADESIAITKYPNLAAQDYVLTADPQAFDPRQNADGFLKPRGGANSTELFVSGYGFDANNGNIPTGNAILRAGTMRFLSWIDPRNGNGSGATPPQAVGGQPGIPATSNPTGFLLQLSRSNGTVNGCAGDSGGPAWVKIADDDYRLVGIRDLISDRFCEGGLAQNGVGNLTSPHFDDFSSLLYTPTREFIRNYMVDHCSDRRAIDLKTGTNEVRAPEQKEIDECPTNPDKLQPGSCGCELTDTDSDADGTADCIDQCQDDSNKFEPGICGCGIGDSDTDNDGTLCNDECSGDPLKVSAGMCGCGTPDTDSDSDGVPDCSDGCIFDPAKTVAGLCGCGVADADGDSDTTPDCRDECSGDPSKIAPGMCGCGIADTDTDSDGVADCLDTCPHDPTKTHPGACGCGIEDVDDDRDGVLNCSDACPTDAMKASAGSCGCNYADTDTDGDGAPDCSDYCPADAAVKHSATNHCTCICTDEQNESILNSAGNAFWILNPAETRADCQAYSGLVCRDLFTGTQGKFSSCDLRLANR